MVVVQDRDFHVRDYYAPCDIDRTGFPEIEAPFDYGQTNWDVRVVALRAGSYEEALASGPITQASLTPDLAGVGVINVNIGAVE